MKKIRQKFNNNSDIHSTIIPFGPNFIAIRILHS